ncbi:unnamed protein product, partial [Ectocarpus sp. 12 AP-2014]
LALFIVRSGEARGSGSGSGNSTESTEGEVCLLPDRKGGEGGRPQVFFEATDPLLTLHSIKRPSPERVRAEFFDREVSLVLDWSTFFHGRDSPPQVRAGFLLWLEGRW